MAENNLSAMAKRYYLQALAQELLPRERVAMCMKHRQSKGSPVEVQRDWDTGKVRYTNLMRCSSIWNCPVCAARITEQRRAEMREALEVARGLKLVPALITLTVKHGSYHHLPELLTRMSESYRKTKSGRAWQNFATKWGIIGNVRAFEITHGGHGWHPHIHELTLLEPAHLCTYETQEAATEALKQEFYGLWSAGLAKFDLSCSYDHGVDVTFAHAGIADYLAKYGRLPEDKKDWSQAEELTKAPTKQARKQNRTPYELLASYGEGDKEAGRLFQAYAFAMRGKHQLQWTRKLREILGIGELTPDADVSDFEPEARIQVLAQLDAEAWRVIIKHGLRGELLEVAAEGDPEKLWDWLDKVPDMAPRDHWLRDYGLVAPVHK